MKPKFIYYFTQIIITCLLLKIVEVNAQGFSAATTNWSVPVGGLKNGATNWGYYLPAYSTAYNYALNSQNWSVLDINGDGMSDLVVTSENLTASTSTVFSPNSNPYWKVYLNNGTGFSTSATNWPIPMGGLKNGATNWGFYIPAYSTAYNYSLNSQNWTLMDINGDSKPDLVVTSENLTASTSTVYSPASNPYWKVYLNNGTGFSTSATNWPIPVGGLKNGATNWGFYIPAYSTAYNYSLYSQNWTLMDINGDSKPDLVVTSENLTASTSTVYSPTSNPYWKVYLNSGFGFSTSATNWPIPVGGIKNGATNWGYYIPAYSTAYNYSLNSQNWTLMDINGDSKPDLVVTSENLTASTSTVYSPTSNPYWKVYLNTGFGFSTSATNWPIPVGGLKNGATNWGFYISAYSTAYNYSLNSQNWTLMDINGDSKPDLVVTSENLIASTSTVYSPASNPYWKVYLNTGFGFSTSATNWPIPVGGIKNGATNWGFYIPAYSTAYNYSLYSQNWTLMDINGDSKPDLVVTSENLTASTSTVYSPTSNPYWKVYLNTSITGGISESDKSLNDFSIYPNPFSNQLSVALAENEQLLISLYDFLGHLVRQETITKSATISTDQLSKGMYLYEIRNSKGTLKTGKVLKR